jgi:hypothetical protein
MNYDEMLKEISANHADHWGGTFAEMTASDKRVAELAEQYPEIYAKALADFNEMLRKM